MILPLLKELIFMCYLKSFKNANFLIMFSYCSLLTQKEMSSLSRSSPHTPRIGSSLARSGLQETSFSSPTQMETEATVQRVNQMFPTANENHIRMLLKK